MATKQEILARAKQIIEADPTSGKKRVNTLLQAEYGMGLRSSTVLRLKQEVANEKPYLFPQLYLRGSVPTSYNEIYRGWLKSGFLAFEARELTLGHGERYKAFDAASVFNSAPGEAARETRMAMVREWLAKGWTKQEIREHIIDYYRKSKVIDPWSHIRAEYKPRKRMDFVDYRTKVRARAKAKQRRLLRIR